ncbi:voltage-gated Ca2+ channel, alpha subunit, partial [Haematococcus lacustris]
AFLKTGWGWLDFLTTASGYLAYLPLGDSSSLSGVRALRALRALRAINAIPGGDSGSGNATWLIVPGYENVPCALHDQGMLACPGDAVCRRTDQNPNNGFTTFDHFGGVALNVFIMLTMDNWSEVLLYPLMNSMGPGVPITFFVLLVRPLLLSW